MRQKEEMLMMKNMRAVRKALAGGLCLAAAAGLAGCGAAPGSASVPSTIEVANVEDQVISVTASEKVKVTPDIAELNLSVSSQEADAESCQTANSQAVNQVTEALKAQGIQESSIQTSNYNLYPIYNWENGQTITGYTMETMITVSDVAIDTVGDVLTAAVNAGVNNIQSVNYMSSQYDESYRQALEMAVQSAYEKANAMAIAGGCSLGEIVKIEERSTDSAARYTAISNMSMEDSSAEAPAAVAGAAVMPGQVSVEANILVEYAVNQ